MTSIPTIKDLASFGCTGYIDTLGRMQHDGDSCPVHEAETISALADAQADTSWYLVSIRHDGDEWGSYAVEATSEDEARRVGMARAPEPDIAVSKIDAPTDVMADDDITYDEVRELLAPPSVAEGRDPRIVEGATYWDESFHSHFTIESIPGVESEDRLVELTNGEWYVLDGPEGLLAKLDAGIIRKVD